MPAIEQKTGYEAAIPQSVEVIHSSGNDGGNRKDMMKIWAWLTRQELVWLRDDDGEVTLTFAKRSPFGLVAKRYWPSTIRTVTCGDDGKVIGLDRE